MGRNARGGLVRGSKPYDNAHLFRDCAAAAAESAEEQAAARGSNAPPGTAGSGRISSRASVQARRALRLATATASSTLCARRPPPPSVYRRGFHALMISLRLLPTTPWSAPLTADGSAILVC
jgi:hypothetical protein